MIRLLLFQSNNRWRGGSVTISSNNANGNTNLAKIGDQVTLSFVATEVIKVGSNPTVVINNNNAVVGRVGDTDKILLQPIQCRRSQMGMQKLTLSPS